MKKKVTLTLCVLLCAMTTLLAQGGILTATLVSNGTSTVYYGEPSLQNAYNASQNGDVIYLSEGRFQNLNNNIEKSISIIGAGGFNAIHTYIDRVSISCGVDSILIEGINTHSIYIIRNGNSTNSTYTISKCRISVIGYDAIFIFQKLEIKNSSVERLGGRDYGRYDIGGAMAVNNSIINNLYGTSSGGETFVSNSIIKGTSYGLANTLLKNCILFANENVSNTCPGIYNTIIAPIGKTEAVLMKEGNWEMEDANTVFVDAVNEDYRSEERRVGKEGLRLCRSRWSPDH